MDFGTLDLGVQGTQEFNMDTDQGNILDILSNPQDIKKIDPKEEAKKEADEKAAEKKAAEEAAKKTPPAEKKEEEEKSVDVLDELDPEKDPENPEAEETEVNQFEQIARNMYELGVFTQEEGEEPVIPANGEELSQMFQKAKQEGATQWLQSFLSSKGEDRAEIFDAIFINGVDPREYFQAYNQVLDFSEMDMAVESNQEAAVREYYSRLKWSAEKIDQKITKLKDYGDLEEESTEIHSKLLEQDKSRLEEIALKAQAEKQAKEESENQYKQSIHKVLSETLKTKELAGIPVTDKLAQQALEFLTAPKWKLPNGDLLTDYDKFILESKKPENVQQRAIMAVLHLTNYDLSRVEKKAITKETNELWSGIKKTSIKNKNQKVEQKGDFWSSL